jgi:hypothetical protein
MYRSCLLVAAALLLFAPAAFAQDVMSPYGDEPGPPPIQPAQQYQYQYPPVPPPVVAPPPQGYCQPPYCYGQQQSPYYQTQQPLYLQPPPPMSFHEVEQPRYGLMVAGLVIFGASWSINAATAYVANEWKLAVPVVGPYMETQNIDTSGSYADANRMVVGLLVFDGLVETAGAIMIFAGALTKHRVRVYDRMRVSVVPTAGHASAGLAAFGRF